MTAAGVRSAPMNFRRDLARSVVLIADPDEEIRGQISRRLHRHGLPTIGCSNGADALFVAGETHATVALVAAQIPVVSAASVATVLKAHSTTVFVGAGGDDAAESALALAGGATACVARPYHATELIRLLQALRPDLPLRDLNAQVLEIGPVRLDPIAHDVRAHDQPVYMPAREFALLEYLMRNADRVVTRQLIREQVWGDDAHDSNTVNVHIRRIRNKLGDDPHDPKLIRTIRGLGYRFTAPEATDV